MFKFASAIVALAGVAQANYLSGEVRSQEWFTYGKFVAKMQNPNKMGTVQSFFTYTAQDWPHGWNEIDVEIVPSVTENPFSMNIIWRDGAQDHNYATGFHPADDWFTYSVEWTPDYVSWYVNDKLVRKTEGAEDVHFLNMPTQLMMNFWTPCWSPWNDYFDDAEMPWYAKYDFVEVYDYDVNSKAFNLRWRDDFNTFDVKKWYASDNWGFENNSSLFMSSQVYVEDGNLVLKMDYNDGHAREYPEHHQVVHHEKPVHEAPHHVEAHHAAKAAHQDPVALDHEKMAHHVAAPASPVVHDTHHEALKHEDAHVVSHHDTHATAHHVVAPVHTVVHHEAPHHVEPVHHTAHPIPHTAEAHHMEAVHHEDIDGHRYEAPLVHHSAYYGHHDRRYEGETGYPHHYSQEEFERVGDAYHETHHGYPEHETAQTRHFKHGYSEGDHGAHSYETIRYESGYPSPHHEQRHEYHVYTAPATEHHLEAGYHEPAHEAGHDWATGYPTHFADRELQDEYPHHTEYPSHHY